MNLNIHHRNVKMNLMFSSAIAQKLFQLEDAMGLTSASVTLEQAAAASSHLRISVELETSDTRIVAEAVDKAPGVALRKLMATLKRQTQRDPNYRRVPKPSLRKSRCGKRSREAS